MTIILGISVKSHHFVHSLPSTANWTGTSRVCNISESKNCTASTFLISRSQAISVETRGGIQPAGPTIFAVERVSWHLKRTQSMHAKLENADTQRPDSGFSARTAHGGSTVSAQDYVLRMQSVLVSLALGVLRLHRQFKLKITHLSHAYTPFHSSVGIFTAENYVQIIKTPFFPVPYYVTHS